MMNQAGSIFKVILLMIGISNPVIGQLISTEAPSQTYSAEVVEKGVFQLESRFQVMKTGSKYYLDLPFNLFRLGLSNKLELRMTNGISVSGMKTFQSQLNALEVGLKYAILNNPDKKSKLAVFTHITLPAPDYDYYRQNAVLCYSLSLGDKSVLATNFVFGYYYANKGHYIAQSYSGTLCYSRRISSRLSLFGEMYGTYHQDLFKTATYSSDVINFDAGIFYLLRDNIQLDYTFGAGLDNTMYFHSLGLDIMFHPSK